MSVPSKTRAVDRADNPRSLRLYACTLYAPRVGQIITAHAIEKLGLNEGQKAFAMIKESSVMIGVDS